MQRCNFGSKRRESSRRRLSCSWLFKNNGAGQVWQLGHFSARFGRFPDLAVSFLFTKIIIFIIINHLFISLIFVSGRGSMGEWLGSYSHNLLNPNMDSRAQMHVELTNYWSCFGVSLKINIIWKSMSLIGCASVTIIFLQLFLDIVSIQWRAQTCKYPGPFLMNLLDLMPHLNLSFSNNFRIGCLFPYRDPVNARSLVSRMDLWMPGANSYGTLWLWPPI